MRKQLSAISILGLILTLFTAGPAVTAPSTLSERSLVAQATSTPSFSASAVNVAVELRTSNLGAVVNEAEIYIFKRLSDTASNLGEEFVDFQEITDGQFTFPFDDGNYSFEVTPTGVNSPALAKTIFTIVVTSGSPVITRSDNTVVTLVGGKYQLPLFTANVVGNLQNPDGSVVITNYEADIFYEVEVLRYQNGDYQGFGQYFRVDMDGKFAVHIQDNGDYKLRFSAFGRTDAAASLSNVFTISGGTLVTLANQKLSTPMLIVRVRSATGSEDLKFVGIQIQKDFEYVGFAFTGPTAVAALSFASAGNYTLTIEPEWGTTGNARASYPVVVTDAGNGKLTAVVTGVTPQSDGSHILRFKAPTISGQVLKPSGTEGVPFAQVMPIRIGDDYPSWEFAGYADGEGRFSLALPEGSFRLYAQPPWGNSLYGDGPQVGPIVVNASGVATSLPAGSSATDFKLRLANPTWSGKIVSPLDNTTPISDASICLRASEFAVMTSCSQTDASGAFALSAPADFTGFDEGSELWVQKWNSPDFTERNFRGKSEVEAVLGVYTQGQSYPNISIALGLPNFEVLVMAGESPASRVWVWADSDLGYIGGKETDANGVARFTLDDEDRAQGIRINTDLWNNPQLSLKFTPTQLFVEPNSLVLDGGIYKKTVNLAVPNFTGIVKKPGSPAVAAGNTGVEVQNLETGDYRWLNVGRNGVFTGNLPGPVAPATSTTYQLKVMPPWDSQEPISSTIYEVVVGANGQVASVKYDSVDAGQENVTIDGSPVSAYVLMLSPSNVLGRVVQGDGENEMGVRDSWIETRFAGTREYLWDKSTNSKFGGNFNMNLDNGDYDLIANAPWNSSKVKSEACRVKVASGAVDKTEARAACVSDQGQVTLKLRDGNLQINLKDPAGEALPFGHIGVAVGNWYSWAQSDRTGKASLFIDIEEIKLQNPAWAAANNTANDLDIRFWFDPPWGKSGISRWECSTADAGLADGSICKVLAKVDVQAGFAAPAGPLNVAFPAPNTVITVTDSAEVAVGVGSWVSIFKIVGNNQNWIEGGQTDFSGKAYFNLDLSDTTGTYMVEVNPPWNRGNQLSSAKHTITGGVAALNNKRLALKTPNTFVTVNRADGKGGARWSWIGLEKVDSGTYNPISWENGASTNQSGRASLSLDANSTYKLTIYPGFASAGTRTTCFLTTGANAVITLVTGKCGAGVLDGANLTVTLSLGNLTGTVTDVATDSKPGPSVAVAGVVVSARNKDTQEIVETVTDQNGKYGLQLDPGDWEISLFFAGTTPQGFELTSRVNALLLYDGINDADQVAFDFKDGDFRNLTLVRK